MTAQNEWSLLERKVENEVVPACRQFGLGVMPYFPLVVLYCQRYVKKTGIGTLISLMLPYSFIFMFTWIVLLLVFWGFGWPLGLDSHYTYSLPG